MKNEKTIDYKTIAQKEEYKIKIGFNDLKNYYLDSLGMGFIIDTFKYISIFDPDTGETYEL